LCINERVRELRKALRLTQVEFGRRIAVGQGYLTNIENGQRPVTEKILKLICKEFNVNEDWLRTGEGEMFRVESELIELLGAKIDDLDDMDKKIIAEYIKLNKKHREIIKNFIRKMI
jgi:transcriptional regulator with XRE-family HTH domain